MVEPFISSIANSLWVFKQRAGACRGLQHSACIGASPWAPPEGTWSCLLYLYTVHRVTGIASATGTSRAEIDLSVALGRDRHDGQRQLVRILLGTSEASRITGTPRPNRLTSPGAAWVCVGSGVYHPLLVCFRSGVLIGTDYHFRGTAWGKSSNDTQLETRTTP